MKNNKTISSVASLMAFATFFTMLFLVGQTAFADRIRMIEGSVKGEVIGSTRDVVRVEVNGETKEVPVVNVVAILFTGEPSTLSQARINVANGGFRTAADKLKDVQLSSKANPVLAEELAFLQAECTARLAINGQIDPREAGRQLVGFQKKYPSGFRYYDSVETMGDLLRSMKRYDRAIKQYQILNKAPWQPHKMQASYLAGLTLQAQGKHKMAIKFFDKAASLKLRPKQGDADKFRVAQMSAQFAKAKSLDLSGQSELAVTLIQKLVAEANAETELGQFTLAAGYNALGNHYLAKKDTTGALLAFLRVDYLHNQSEEIHAESLYHMIDLWKAYGKPEESRQAKAKLTREYADTIWASNIGS